LNDAKKQHALAGRQFLLQLVFKHDVIKKMGRYSKGQKGVYWGQLFGVVKVLFGKGLVAFLHYFVEKV